MKPVLGIEQKHKQAGGVQYYSNSKSIDLKKKKRQTNIWQLIGNSESHAHLLGREVQELQDPLVVPCPPCLPLALEDLQM